MSVHPTAIIHPKARLAEDAEIGPWCVIGEHVEIGEAARLLSHVSVAGHTRIGARTVVHPFAALGEPAQDLKSGSSRRALAIGSDNVIREHVTLHLATGEEPTRVGNGCLLMVGAHVGHDCQIGDSVTLTNHATMGGSCTIADHATLGGLCAVHQGITIARHAFVSGCAPLGGDVIPFGVVNRDGWLNGLNIVGMKRAGFARAEITALRRAYAAVFGGEGVSILQRAQEMLDTGSESPLVEEMIRFVLDRSRGRRLCTLKVR